MWLLGRVQCHECRWSMRSVSVIDISDVTTPHDLYECLQL